MLSEDKRIKSKQQLQEFLELEYKRFPIHGRRYISYLLQLSEGAILRKHTKLLRYTEYHINCAHKLRGAIYWARLMRLQNKYGMHVPINCFDKGLTIYHLSPIVVNGKVSVGKNCTLMPNTNIVTDHKGSPTPVLGDNIFLGIGSSVVGNVYLADGITVGAGAVVTRSFYEPGVHIAGVPAKIIEKREGSI